MRFSSPIPHKKARIEIIPLIDIMFFLLASFMMVSLSQTHMKGIRVNLPAATAVPPNQKKDYVAIRVSAGNNIYFDGELVPDNEVLPRLYQLHQANPDIKVSLSAEEQAVLNKPVSDLNLSVRARKCMNRLNIGTLGELCQRTADELLEAKNFGQTSLTEVREKLVQYNLKLRGD